MWKTIVPIVLAIAGVSALVRLGHQFGKSASDSEYEGQVARLAGERDDCAEEVARLESELEELNAKYELGDPASETAAIDEIAIKSFEVQFSIGEVEKEGAGFSLRLEDAQGAPLDSESATFGLDLGEGGKTDAVYLGTSSLSIEECTGLRLIAKAKTPKKDKEYEDHWKMEPIIVAILTDSNRLRVYVEPSGMIDFYTPEAAAEKGLDMEATVQEWELKCTG